MTRFALALTLAGTIAFGTPLAAQGRDRGPDRVPPSYEPPPGMCRIWIDGVPPGQQPAPTDCATAVRNRPANGRVIFGDDVGRKKIRGRTPPGVAALVDGDDGDRRDRRRLRAERDDAERDDEDDDGDAPRQVGRRDRDDDDRYERIFRRGSDICPDLNRDGRCDDAQRGGDVCVDQDRDGICDNAYGDGAGGAALPGMTSAVLAAQGQRPGDVLRWFGDQDVTARYVDADRDGVPERVTWLDQEGRVVQVWTDRTGAGRATRVEFFRNGRRVKVVGQ